MAEADGPANVDEKGRESVLRDLYVQLRRYEEWDIDDNVMYLAMAARVNIAITALNVTRAALSLLVYTAVTPGTIPADDLPLRFDRTPEA